LSICGSIQVSPDSSPLRYRTRHPPPSRTTLCGPTDQDTYLRRGVLTEGPMAKETHYSSGVAGSGSPQEILDGLRCRSAAARERWVSYFPCRSSIPTWGSRHPHSTTPPSDWCQLEFPSPNGGCLATLAKQWVSGNLKRWVSLRQESSRKEEVTRTQKPFVATLRVNEPRPAERGQQPEASLAWGGVTLTAKRRQRVPMPCYRAPKYSSREPPS
jgi:hypothetical protein